MIIAAIDYSPYFAGAVSAITTGTAAFAASRRISRGDARAALERVNSEKERERGLLVQQLNDELTKLYMVELKQRRYMLELMTAATIGDWEAFKLVAGRVINEIGQPSDPPSVRTGSEVRS